MIIRSSLDISKILPLPLLRTVLTFSSSTTSKGRPLVTTMARRTVHKVCRYKVRGLKRKEFRTKSAAERKLKAIEKKNNKKKGRRGRRRRK